MRCDVHRSLLSTVTSIGLAAISTGFVLSPTTAAAQSSAEYQALMRRIEQLEDQVRTVRRDHDTEVRRLRTENAALRRAAPATPVRQQPAPAPQEPLTAMAAHTSVPVKAPPVQDRGRFYGSA